MIRDWEVLKQTIFMSLTIGMSEMVVAAPIWDVCWHELRDEYPSEEKFKIESRGLREFRFAGVLVKSEPRQ